MPLFLCSASDYYPHGKSYYIRIIPVGRNLPAKHFDCHYCWWVAAGNRTLERCGRRPAWTREWHSLTGKGKKDRGTIRDTLKFSITMCTWSHYCMWSRSDFIKTDHFRCEIKTGHQGILCIYYPFQNKQNQKKNIFLILIFLSVIGTWHIVLVPSISASIKNTF